jgi:hypothetical protein
MIGTIMRAGGIFFPNENKEKTDGRHKWALRVTAVMRFHSADGRWDICVNYSTSRVSMSKSLLSQTHTLCTRIYERDRKCQMRITFYTRKEIRNENNIHRWTTVHTKEDIILSYLYIYTYMWSCLSQASSWIEVGRRWWCWDSDGVWKPTQRAATRRQELGTLLLAGHSMPALQLRCLMWNSNIHSALSKFNM